jgi:protein-S-isoprenylcysteine O-methyltransferase Ste14
MRLILLALFSVSFLAYASAIAWLFRRPDRMPGRMRALSIVGLIAAGVHVAYLATMPVGRASAPAALIVYLLGLLLFVWASVTIRRQRLPIAFSSLAPVRVTRDGPYRFLRHPFYVAYSLTWIAGVVATRSLVVGATALVMGAFYVSAAIKEERQLLSSPLADDYREYRRRTSAWIPWLGRRSARHDHT